MHSCFSPFLPPLELSLFDVTPVNFIAGHIATSQIVEAKQGKNCKTHVSLKFNPDTEEENQ
jgi:hypothetical protein